MSTYQFKNDDGEIREVDFETMMEMDAQGFLYLDGQWWLRIRKALPKPKPVHERTECVSDALGIARGGLADRLEHLQQSGIRGVEYREDPDVPGFFQCVCDNQDVKMRYARSLGYDDKNSRNGGNMCLTEADIEAARELVCRRHSK